MAAPFSTLLSLIVMHGISMTVWRHLMNTTMPFSVRSNNNLPRFTFQLSNTLTPPTGVDNLLTTLSPLSSSSSPSSSHSLITSGSSSAFSSSSPSSAYIQPIIQLHPIPISLPSLTGLQGLTGLTGFPASAGSSSPMILLPISARPPESANLNSIMTGGYQFKGQPSHQPMLTLSQIPAGQAVVQVAPTLVTQASTLKPIRVAAPFNFLSSSISPTVSPIRGVINPKGTSTYTYREVKLTGGKSSTSNSNGHHSIVTKKMGQSTGLPIKLINSNQSDEMVDLNSIVSDSEMINLQEDIKQKGFRSICFYLLDNPDKGIILPVNKIDPKLCDQITVGFAYVGPDNLIWFQNPENDVKRLQELASLKTRNPSLKILLSVRMGQSKDNSTTITKMTSGQSADGNNILATEEMRNRFVRSLIEIITLYKLDGVDFFRLHQNETKYRETKSDLITLLKLTRKECLRKGKLESLITATVSGHPDIATNYYNITELVKSVDYLNLLTFDYHYYSEAKPYTGHHSLLYPRVTTHSGIDISSTDEVCKFWMKQKIPIRKLILSVPTFARTFNLAFPFGQGFNSPSIGPGLGQGQINYTQVCSFIKDGGISEFDEKGQVPFAHRNYDWISYENERSLSIKSRYSAAHRLGGVMTYALNYDDWTGSCREDEAKNFPLQKAVSSTLKLASVSTFKN